ncbi:unnamed protein product [Rodentolepis nana]|uniref:Protocadherin-16-like n=1 Tax=Rodentolepis nana TaxID=102285 RepID=A0A0R3T9G7_RODNA|nr:unnamed protein product [Rodentolepis nana]
MRVILQLCELYLTNSLDYERTPRYFLTIEAKDGGSPPLSTTTVVTINVVDENDNSPYFIGQDVTVVGNFSESSTSETPEIGVYSFEVYENSPVGTQIGRVTARDPDLGENGRLSFSICESMQPPGEVMTVEISSRSSSTTGVGRRFEVGESRGEINLLFSPDREVASLYEFMVCVVDHGEPPRSAVTKVQVTIRDTNDCQPQFERSNYEFYVQVNRNGNVVSTDQLGSSGNVSRTEDAEILLGHLALRDMDAYPNSGPFKCKLTGFVGSSSVGSWDTSTPLFIVKTVSASLDAFSGESDVAPTPADMTFFQNLDANQTGFCSLYAASTLPLGSKNLVVRAHDSGMTALHSSVTITVHISRQSNLPPEIVSSNTTLVIFRDTSSSTAPSLKRRFDLDNSISATKAQKAQDSPLMKVTVRDRTAYDHLFFELLPNPFAAHFIIDQYDGSIYVKSSTSGPMESGVSATIEKDPSLEWLEPSLPQLPVLAQLNSGDYKLRVRVANGSLSSNGTLHLKVITVTEEMVEAACVLHVADISPNELFLSNLNEVILQELADGLFKQSTPKERAQAKDNIFLISVQSGSSMMRMQKRSVGGGSDMLIAAYAQREKRFIESSQLVQRIHALQANLSKSVGHQLHAYNSLCAQKVMPYFN